MARRTQEGAEWEAAQPINELQANFMTTLAHLNGAPAPDHITTQGDVRPFLREHVDRFLRND